jgi:hypothetical protein
VSSSPSLFLLRPPVSSSSISADLVLLRRPQPRHRFPGKMAHLLDLFFLSLTSWFILPTVMLFPRHRCFPLVSSGVAPHAAPPPAGQDRIVASNTRTHVSGRAPCTTRPWSPSMKASAARTRHQLVWLLQFHQLTASPAQCLVSAVGPFRRS